MFRARSCAARGQPERRRHLLRLWLAPPDGWPLPDVFAQRYGSVQPGTRGGVPSADGRLRANLPD